MITNRKNTKKVMIGNVQIGNNNKVVIQSMTNTKTSNADATLKQINELVKNGCELVRVAILDIDDSIALRSIVKKSPCPIIADIHYNYQFAINAIESGVKKIRINPANIKDENQLHQIVYCAKKHNIAIRIGFNKGSYEGISNTNLIKSVIYYIKKFESWKFFNIVVSIKSSNLNDTILLNQELAKKTKYPIHLGLTEAGTYEDAIIKSSICLYQLLKMNIGNTIRISISGSPINEPIIAKKILHSVGLYDKYVNVITCPTCGRLQWDIQSFINKMQPIVNSLNKKLTIAIMGCSVNGVGESKHAGFGVYGNKTHGFIYKNSKLIAKVKHNQLITKFKKLLLR